MLNIFAGIAILLLAALGLAWYAYRLAFHSPDRVQNDIYNIPKTEQYQVHHAHMAAMIETFDHFPYERVSITSHDGLKLAGRYYHRQDGAPLAIGFHGYRGTAVRDFCGGGKLSLELGHNLLLVDQRAHGWSDGHTIAFGVKERYDCLDWIRYALDRFGSETKILLYGVSMGAATVLMASGLELPDNVRGIVADSPYTCPEDIIRKVCRDRHMPDAIVYPFITLGARLFGDLAPSVASAVEAVKNTPAPILLIHGEADHFVPCHMSETIRQARPDMIQRHTFPEAGHGISFVKDPDRYRQLVTDFISTCFATIP